MRGIITRSNPGGGGVEVETKPIFSKFMFIETGVNAGKNDSKGFTAGQNKMKQNNKGNKQKHTQG